MSALMCCLEPKVNRIDVETVHERIEVRKGRLLRVIVKDRGGSSDLPPDSADSTSVRINTWINGVNKSHHEGSREGSNTGYQGRIVVFLIHGVGGCADVWYKQIDYFSKSGYIVVAPDLLGHGGSDAPREPAAYQFSELSRDMFAVFDRYRSEKKNILIGHSYG